MGSSKNKLENSCIEESNNIEEDSLDISNIDKLQIKAIKENNNKIKEIENKKSDKIMYKLPNLQFCNYSLIE